MMKNQVQTQSSKPFFSIIPLVEEAKSKISQQFPSSNFQKPTNNESRSEIFYKENSDLTSPKRYKFSDDQKNSNSRILNDSNSSKKILRKIIFSESKPNSNKSDKIKKYNSDFPEQKNEEKSSILPNSISDSKISEKDAQLNSRKIVFLIKSPSGLHNESLVEKDTSIINKSNSEFNSKEKVPRKSIQAAKSSSNLQNENFVKPKNSIENDENKVKIKKSKSDLPTPKKTKSESAQKADDNEIKTNRKNDLPSNEKDQNLTEKKIKKFNSDFPNQKKLEADQKPSKNEEDVKKIPRKSISSTKSSNNLPNQSQNSTSKTKTEKLEKIKKFNSDFPEQKKLETDQNVKKIPRKVNPQNQNLSQKTEVYKSNTIKKFNSDFLVQKKSESELKSIKDEENKASTKIQNRQSQKVEDLKSNSNIKKFISDFISKKKNENEETEPKISKEKIKKIPRKPIGTIKSSNNLPNSIHLNQKSSSVIDEKKSDKIKKCNSDFISQKKKDHNNELEQKVSNDKENVNKIPRKNIDSKKSSNDLKNQKASTNSKEENVRKFNSDFPIQKKLESEEKSSKNQEQSPNSKPSLVKEKGNKTVIEKEKNETPNENQIKSQKDDLQNEANKKTIHEFIPNKTSRNNSPNQLTPNNAKSINIRKQDSPDNSKNNQNKNNGHKIKNIQIEYKNKQEPKPKENSNSNIQPQKSPINVSIKQNQKQKLNIILKPKETSSQQKEAEKSKAIQPKEIEKSKEAIQPKEAEKSKEAIQQMEIEKSKETIQQKEIEKPNGTTQQKETQPHKENKKARKEQKHSSHTKENRFVWKDTTPPKEEQTTQKEPENEDKTQLKESSNIIEEIVAKDAIALNESSTKLNEEIKKQIKYEIEKAQQSMMNPSSANNNKQKNLFTLKMCIESQPVCIAVGDIEGDVEKLQQICSFIKSNPTLHFVFIGDIIDDLSDACPSSSQSWECLSLLSEFFISNFTFSLDNTEEQKSDNLINLPSSFCDVSFKEVKYGNIRSRVKFLAGNAECDNLLDFQKPCQIVPGEVTNYIFGQGKWMKTVTFEKMCLLYRYLKSCYGIIKMKKTAPEDKKNSSDFVDTVYFRHSPSSFKINRFPKNMYFPNPDLKKSDVEKRNYFFITGHARIFASILSQKHDNKEMLYVVDTTVLDAQNQYLKDVGGFGTNDRRLALVSYDKEIGFSVKAISLPCPFPKSTLKCTISDKYIQIKGI